ncbi:erythrocyte membrane protein 1 [Plasmodium falciparum RAJ116]|uniref:Erythrocyte membrane protein 1 n=1 Tax=Plasmodium falciparum RAJ116 TaxID=580058 RepID=A0A0L0CYC6_PLAFA|nr:erythrocyte membrane protein 1 [Plasmodium falciparum RAJ116]
MYLKTLMRYLPLNRQIGMSRMKVADINAIFTTKSPRRNGRLNYIREISSSDITSSSESEYEEIDLNDIYVSGSPKYKMFIEVVLEPLNRDTFNLSSGNTSTNKLTDNEWNQWKQDFIEQYLQNIQKDFILHDSVNEKPFITSI